MGEHTIFAILSHPFKNLFFFKELCFNSTCAWFVDSLTTVWGKFPQLEEAICLLAGAKRSSFIGLNRDVLLPWSKAFKSSFLNQNHFTHSLDYYLD